MGFVLHGTSYCSLPEVVRVDLCGGVAFASHFGFNSLSSVKTAQSSLARGLLGADQGYPEFEPGTPTMG